MMANVIWHCGHGPPNLGGCCHTGGLIWGPTRMDAEVEAAEVAASHRRYCRYALKDRRRAQPVRDKTSG